MSIRCKTYTVLTDFNAAVSIKVQIHHCKINENFLKVTVHNSVWYFFSSYEAP
jgi:hypothetical protein